MAPFSFRTTVVFRGVGIRIAIAPAGSARTVATAAQPGNRGNTARRLQVFGRHRSLQSTEICRPPASTEDQPQQHPIPAVPRVPAPASPPAPCRMPAENRAFQPAPSAHALQSHQRNRQKCGHVRVTALPGITIVAASPPAAHAPPRPQRSKSRKRGRCPAAAIHLRRTADRRYRAPGRGAPSGTARSPAQDGRDRKHAGLGKAGSSGRSATAGTRAPSVPPTRSRAASYTAPQKPRPERRPAKSEGRPEPVPRPAAPIAITSCAPRPAAIKAIVQTHPGSARRPEENPCWSWILGRSRTPTASMQNRESSTISHLSRQGSAPAAPSINHFPLINVLRVPSCVHEGSAPMRSHRKPRALRRNRRALGNGIRLRLRLYRPRRFVPDIP